MAPTRRDFLKGIAASCALGGCASPGKPEPAGASGAPPPPGELVDFPADLRAPGGQAKATLSDGSVVLLWNDEAGLHAVAGRCTHKGGELFYDPERADIACPEHKSRFYPDGAVQRGPAQTALARYTVAEEGGRLRIAPRA